MAHLETKFASIKQDWETPPEVFDKLNEEFHFDFDLAANAENTKCERWFSEEEDAMKQPWAGVCWLNPPYGKDKDHKLSNWVIKAYHESAKDDCTVVMLIPARTNTKWWHEYCMKADEVRLVCGRPKFIGAMHGLPQPLAVVVFSGNGEGAKFGSFHLAAS